MKVLFLDIDGVVNSAESLKRAEVANDFIGIDPYMAILVDRIIQATGCEVVLSSSWRNWADGREYVRKRVCDFIDVTPNHPSGSRGEDIALWLAQHPQIERYAILDDDADMRKEQLPNFFKTEFSTGLHMELAAKVVDHLNQDEKTVQG